MEDPVETGDHLAAAGSPWPENPNCIYMGGFGIGPMNPVSSWDEDLGLWVRAVALRDRQGDDLVLVVLDGEGYFWDYGTKCDDCGIKQLTQQLAADEELGLEAEDIVVAATHAHSSPDFIGGWGFVPDWYMKQVADTIKGTVRDAVASMRPAVLEYGEQEARAFNNERRDTYRSAEEQQLAWLRAYVPASDRARAGRSRRRPETIATLGAYAAHPTTFGTNDGEAHPGLARPVREEPGGALRRRRPALHDRAREHVGRRASSTSATRAGRPAPTTSPGWSPASAPATGSSSPTSARRGPRGPQPVTNAPLTALGAPGFFDRQFAQSPATVRTGEDPDKFQCTSAVAGVGRGRGLGRAHRRRGRPDRRAGRDLLELLEHVKEQSRRRR